MSMSTLPNPKTAPNRIRDERLRLGIGQTDLAERAGVTRQLVGAIEAGRHSPSVDAALRIAKVLGLPVEELFASPVNETTMSLLDQPVVSGEPLVAGRVGEVRVFAPVRHLQAADAWAVADGFTTDDGAEIFADADVSGLVVAGCDPLLGLAASLLAQRGGPRVVPVHLSTGAAAEALGRGVVHGVVVHGPLGSLPRPTVEVRRWRVASWQVGVASLPRRRLGSVEQLAERRLRTAQRDPGAETQRALVRALKRVGAPGLPGPIVDGHVDAVRHVVAGVAAGVTMEAAARAFGLDFLALETHHSELWIDARHVGHRGATALVDALHGTALLRRAERLPGYDVARMGEEVLAS